MMQRITALAPQLTFCELMQASKIIIDILHVRAQAGAHQQQSSSEADSPLRPQQLDYSPDGPLAGSGRSEPVQDGAVSRFTTVASAASFSASIVAVAAAADFRPTRLRYASDAAARRHRRRRGPGRPTVHADPTDAQPPAQPPATTAASTASFSASVVAVAAAADFRPTRLRYASDAAARRPPPPPPSRTRPTDRARESDRRAASRDHCRLRGLLLRLRRRRRRRRRLPLDTPPIRLRRPVPFTDPPSPSRTRLSRFLCSSPI